MNSIIINGDVNINSVFETIKTCEEFTKWAGYTNLSIKYWRTLKVNEDTVPLSNALDYRKDGDDWGFGAEVDESEFSLINEDNMNAVDCYTYIYDTDDYEDDPDLTEDEKDHCDMDFCVFVIGNKIIGFQTHED